MPEKNSSASASRLPQSAMHIVAKSAAPVPSDSGLGLVPTHTFGNCPRLDLICVPGGNRGVIDAMGDRETIDFMYTDAGLKVYADWLNIPEAKARRTRDDFFPKSAIDPDRIVGLDTIVKDAVALKFTASELTKEQLAELIQIPPR